jgi:hypothetical protein
MTTNIKRLLAILATVGGMSVAAGNAQAGYGASTCLFLGTNADGYSMATCNIAGNSYSCIKPSGGEWTCKSNQVAPSPEDKPLAAKIVASR